MEITQDIYFDVAKHANAWGVAHEEASKRIQEFLFESSIYWAGASRGDIFAAEALYLFVREKDITYSYFAGTSAIEATLQASTTYTLYIEQLKAKEEDNEIIQLLGKKYSKADIEKALQLLTPKEEV